MEKLHTTDFIKFFKNNAVKIREQNNLTQDRMAKLLGIKQSLLGAIEEGRTLSIETVYLFSCHFNYTIDELITTFI